MSRNTSKSLRPGLLAPWKSRPLIAWQEEMEDFFGASDDDDRGIWSHPEAIPSVSLAEHDADLEITMELPGAEAEPIDVQLSGNVLTDSGSREEDKQDKNKTFHRVERRTGSFSRSVRLPCAVKESGVTATFDATVLSVKLPKADEGRTRRITVDH